jgi:hypothetical protein
VGYLPVTENLALALLPKTPIHNLLRMLEIAYQFSREPAEVTAALLSSILPS